MCDKYGWQYSYHDYNRQGLEIVDSGIISPSCATREYCEDRFQHLVSTATKAAESYRGYAQDALERAKSFKESGDSRWYEKAMRNHKMNLLTARARELRAASAVAPHCDLDKVFEQISSEFGSKPAGQTSKPTATIAGVDEQKTYEPSQRTLDALAEMRENYERAGVLTAVVATVPFLMTLDDIPSVSMATFPWDAWEKTMASVQPGMSRVAYGHNRNICAIEFLYWSSRGRSQTQQGRAERDFWGRLCKGMQ